MRALLCAFQRWRVGGPRLWHEVELENAVFQLHGVEAQGLQRISAWSDEPAHAMTDEGTREQTARAMTEVVTDVREISADLNLVLLAFLIEDRCHVTPLDRQARCQCAEGVEGSTHFRLAEGGL